MPSTTARTAPTPLDNNAEALRLLRIGARAGANRRTQQAILYYVADLTRPRMGARPVTALAAAGRLDAPVLPTVVDVSGQDGDGRPWA